MIAYRFYGKKNQAIKSQTTGNTVFSFDVRGHYMTCDEEIIARAVGKFKYDILNVTETGAEVISEVEEQSKKFKCKKCDFETENKGLLLAHYREHSKEDV